MAVVVTVVCAHTYARTFALGCHSSFCRTVQVGAGPEERSFVRSSQQCELQMYFPVGQRVNTESDTHTHTNFSRQIINSQRYFVQNRERKMPTGLGREFRGAASVWWGQKGAGQVSRALLNRLSHGQMWKQVGPVSSDKIAKSDSHARSPYTNVDTSIF